ncbi:hypothetical protein AB1388_11710 [Streptomyces hydrogenans]|uniref:hypothetical protein n=1 Tax=Streptomyces hydrogenans TaxID=1873719 RepID=UPI00345CFF7B
MDSVLHAPGRFGPRTLLITTAAVALTGWAIHAVALHKRLAATRRDPLTGLLRRDAYTTRARRLLACHEDTAVVMVTGDPLKLMRLFGITAQTAMRYVAAAYPERTARLPR